MTPTAHKNSFNAFYLIGLAMTVGSIVLVLAGNTELAGRLEHTGFPLSWGFAVAAIVAFLAAEAAAAHSKSPSSVKKETELRRFPQEAFERWG
jgi:hypothetical protein